MELQLGHKYLLKSEDSWDSYLLEGYTLDKSYPTIGAYLRTIEDIHSNILHLFAVIDVNGDVIGGIEFEDDKYECNFIIDKFDNANSYRMVVNSENINDFDKEELKNMFKEYLVKRGMFDKF